MGAKGNQQRLCHTCILFTRYLAAQERPRLCANNDRHLISPGEPHTKARKDQLFSVLPGAVEQAVLDHVVEDLARLVDVDPHGLPRLRQLDVSAVLCARPNELRLKKLSAGHRAECKVSK